MAFIKADRVQETSRTTGSGPIFLDGAYSVSYRAFGPAGINMANGDTCQILTINEDANSEWEINEATYVAADNSLDRTLVLSSSNNNDPVVFSSGVKRVAMLLPASAMVVEDNAGNASISNNLTVGGGLSVGSPSSFGTAGQVLTSNGPGTPPSWQDLIMPDLDLTAVPVNLSSSGDSTIVSGIPSVVIAVHRVVLAAASPVTIQFKSNTTELSGPQSVSQIGLSASATPYYETTAGEGLVISLGSAIQVGGTIWYKQVS
jgi:hypothetical protein